MKVNVFFAKCITNLHVGNGDVNYNIIDQEVEKDPVTDLPMINASGVKGALREHFEAVWGKDDSKIKKYFGTGDNETAQGSYKFLQADILFRPLRVSSDGRRSYALATTDEILRSFADKVSGVGSNLNLDNACQPVNEKISLEGEAEINLKKLQGKWTKVTEETVAIVDKLSKYDLPVIARNVLDDNGTSKNLWYEEFVPHESVFGFIILTPDEMDSDFKKELTSTPIQFGANASIGYGLMRFTEVE